MSREIKLGAFAFIVLIVSIWGYTFLKGKNPLKKSFTFETVYENVMSLSKSSKVFINGYAVGSVLDVELNEDNLKEMVVSFNIEGDYKIPKNAIVEQVNDGVMGGKVLSISFNRQCTGADCAQKGDRLKGRTVGLLGSMLSAGEVKEYASAIGSELSTVMSSIGTENGEGAINQTVLELQQTMENLTKLTETTNRIMDQSAKNLTITMKNMASITGNLAESNAQITAMLQNFNQVSSQLKDANIGNTINATANTLDEAKVAIKQLQGTITNADAAMKNLNALMSKASNGDGTLAMLLNDKDLYNNLESTSQNLSFLLQDFRLNPGRYVKVSVFGGKNKDPYVKPENDPAYEKK
ncbi:MAG: phospholipid/cholesterol/gamma-HCH transport system substrate-binding protein [Saprospiraceae bacterium]|jgi:phospholipid/cholesterol/gamma-HCH transport system substrate-binding protein